MKPRAPGVDQCILRDAFSQLADGIAAGTTSSDEAAETVREVYRKLTPATEPSGEILDLLRLIQTDQPEPARVAKLFRATARAFNDAVFASEDN